MTAPHKILIAPLDWGLGHATRCVPIIRQQIAAGNEVMLAANGSGAAFLKKYFPGIIVREDIPAYDINYPQSGSMTCHMLLQSPRILSVIRKENGWLNDIIEKEHITGVISDNRYGLYSEKIKSTLITHQLFIQGPSLLMPLLKSAVKKYVKRFDECWVPDCEGEKNLSGALSHGKDIPPNVKYIGALSRFSKEKHDAPNAEGPEFLALISGPEPQRTVLQDALTDILKEIDVPSLMICGQPQNASDITKKRSQVVSHLNDPELKKAILSAGSIICRPGYSTIMDLYALGKKALLIPTPGQTEQEYLAQHLCSAYGFAQLDQKDLSKANLQHAIKDLDPEMEELTQQQLDEKYMRLAMREAMNAYDADEVPIGCVIICQGKLIARGYNLTERLHDFTAHAEMQAYTAASEYLGGKSLNECTLYVTLEPCVMCAGAAYNTRIGRIVFGAYDEKRGYTMFGNHSGNNQTIVHPKCEVTGGVLGDECASILKSFFEKRRD